METDPLEVDLESMGRLGYQTVDMLVDRVARLWEQPVLRRGAPAEPARRLDGPPPEGPERFDRTSSSWPATSCRSSATTTILGSSPTSPAAAPGRGSWVTSSPAPATSRPAPGSRPPVPASSSWWCSAGSSGGSAIPRLVSGGSAANLTALACAREALPGVMSDQVVAYLSDQVHSSMARAARILGFRPNQVRVLPVDDGYRMRTEALAAAMAADLRDGRRPLFVAASAGSTSTGAVDPLPELAVCRERGAWFHVHAAYGGFAALTGRARAWLAGMELADSVTLDPHKWLYQPFECGCLLVRAGQRLREAFRIQPNYLKDTETGELAEVNFSDLSVQLSRTEAIDRSIDLALGAQARIEASPRLELLSPARLGIVCFHRRAEGMDEEGLERLNQALAEGLAASGRGLVSSTRLRGRFALRMCVLNHTSRAEDVERMLDWFERAPAPAEAAALPVLPPTYDRDPPVAQSWPYRRLADGLDIDTLRRLPLFRPLTDGQLERVASLAGERPVAAGEVILQRWDATREFYLATVTATSPMRLLVMADADLEALMDEIPELAAEITRTARDRLPGL